MKTLAENLEYFRVKQNEANLVYKPLFYRINNLSEQEKFNDLLLVPGVIIVDYILDQIKELIKYKTPSKKFTNEELETEAKNHIGKLSINEYGVWVYYPWSNRLVHILDENEFIDIRTSRNQNKITKEERDILATKKIGVIGLSVGQSVSVTMAMERICGELRLADFDILELTNLNRIRTGIHNLGLAKVYSVAREIAEIDPFIKVVCFPKGLTEDNMDDFFTGNGKLDLLVEESDGFDIKILSRYKARELKIPVIMEASDRCMVDVERFDLEPNRSILHGLVEHLDINKLKSLKTNEEKIPYMLDVLGLETASVRLKASMLEIEQTINTWPQLASAVTMGGGITADVSRRMLLNYYTESGRFHIDIEELIGNKKEEKKEIINSNKSISLSLNEKEMSRMTQILISKNDTNEEFVIPSNEQIKKIVDSAIKAPSGGNMQPWKWIYTKGNLFLFHDRDRSTSLLDYDNLASYIGLGAATENLILEANSIGLNPIISIFPLKEESRLIAQFRFSNKPINASAENDFGHLVSEIGHRFTNRNISERKNIDKSILKEIENATCSIKGANLIVVEDETKIIQLAEIISKVERIRMLHERGHKDFVNEIRWSNEENLQKRDGVDISTVDITAAEKAGFIVAKNWEVISLIKKWKTGKAFEKLSKKSVLNSSALCLITMPNYTPEDYFNGGRSVQRTWLAANKMGISLQPQSPATFFFARLTHGKGIELDTETKEELLVLRNEFLTLMNLDPKTSEIFLFRLLIADEPKVKSLRRDVGDVLMYE